jgi:hypothetical protein
MKRRLLRVSAAVLTLACAGARSASSTSSPTLVARAIIGERAARFVLPVETVDSLGWPGSPPHAYPGYPLHYWEIGWEHWLRRDRIGEDPEGILLLLTWQNDPTQQWGLADLLERAPPQVLTFCNSCGTPAVIPRVDSAVSATFERHRVVILVRGQEAIRRIFPHVPDSVSFSRTRSGQDADDDHDNDERLTVAVEHSEP